MDVRTTPVALELLANELQARGFETHLVEPDGKRPYLHVRNPRARILVENIVTDADWYWYSWAERISPVHEVADAVKKISRVLSTADAGHDPAI